MRFTNEELLDHGNRVSRIIMRQLSRTPVAMEAALRDKFVDVEITINGEKTDIKALVEDWQEGVTRAIREEADELVKAKSRSLLDLVEEAERRMRIALDETPLDFER